MLWVFLPFGGLQYCATCCPMPEKSCLRDLVEFYVVFFYSGRSIKWIIIIIITRSRNAFYSLKNVIIFNFNMYYCKETGDLGSLCHFYSKVFSLLFWYISLLTFCLHLQFMNISILFLLFSLNEKTSLIYPIQFLQNEEMFLIALFYSSPCYFLCSGHMKYLC